jgi:hypothetical protein
MKGMKFGTSINIITVNPSFLEIEKGEAKAPPLVFSFFKDPRDQRAY